MSISIVSAKRNEMPSTLLRGMYKLRHEVFNKRLNWEVEDFGELEIDQFDYRNPNYIVAKTNQNKIIGCWRLIPTSKQYMLEEVFHEMLGDYPLPKNETIWELSRFAVVDRKLKGYALSEATALMMKGIIDFASQNNISKYLGVTSVGFERLMKSAGLPIERIGLEKPVRLGDVSSVLCLFTIDESFIEATNRLLNQYAPLEEAA